MPKKSTKKTTRRGNNEGTIYQRKDGRWCAQVIVGYNKDNKPVRKTVYDKSKQDLLKKLKSMSLDVLENGYTKTVDANMTFETAYMEWLLNFKQSAVSSRTFETYIFRAKCHILKVGDKLLTKVQSLDIQTVLNEMEKRGLGYELRIKTYNDYSQFYRYAKTEGIIKADPMGNVIKPRRTRKEHSDREDEYLAIPTEQRTNVLEALDCMNHFFLKPILLTMMYAGLRIGEVIALRWKNIDFDNAIIHVKSSMNIVTEFDDKGNITGRHSEISDTKTDCSVRQVPISDFLMTILKTWQKYQMTQEEVFGFDLTENNAVVFPTRTGTKRTYHGIRMNIQRFNKRHGFENYHAHTYRHTFATMLFEQKVNPKIVQRLMGHRDVKTTLKIYNSISQESVLDSVNMIVPASIIH